MSSIELLVLFGNYISLSSTQAAIKQPVYAVDPKPTPAEHLALSLFFFFSVLHHGMQTGLTVSG